MGRSNVVSNGLKKCFLGVLKNVLHRLGLGS